ncbi:MAG: DUF3108 domain-containing protein [Gammaproteobacteria bacterium]|nr:DUF3108 domain-containing protein [Gammaproteobacteria bacterium]MDH3767531.1 DUF3108 domain-containing protein [Gammaproteobacteria bacterium]
MRTVLLTLLILPLHVAAADIEPFTAHYDLRFSGLAGVAVTTLSQDGEGSFVLENRTRAKGLARLARPRDAIERSEFVVDTDRLKPVSFLSKDGTKRNKRGSSIDFDWSASSANTQYKGETRTLNLEDGMLDRQLLQIAMMSDLSNGVTDTSYTVIDRHSTKTYAISVLARETIEVPAGSYDVVKIRRERAGSSRSSILWCAPSLGYVTVKMQQLKDGKVIGTLSLTEIS